MNYVDLRRGHVLKHEGDLYVVVGTEHITPGNWRGICQIKMKNIKTGSVVPRRFRPQDKVEVVWVDKKEMQYLYRDGDHHIFMDMTTYEQFPFGADLLGDSVQWLVPNITVSAESYDGKIINVVLPDVVEYEITETDPAVKGQTATNQYKPAVLETGVRVMVPPFIAQGERIRVDTRDGKYLERAKG